MFSRFDNEEVASHFDALNAQLKRMPPEDRAEVHQELRQHLDTLIAAHEELGATPQEATQAALRQFGDPTLVGRRLMREWKTTMNKRHGPLWKLVLSVGTAEAALYGLIHADRPFLFGPHPGSSITSHGLTPILLFSVCSTVVKCLIPLIAGTVIGYKLSRRAMPEQTLPAALYAALIGALCPALLFSLYSLAHPVVNHGQAITTVIFPTSLPIEWAALECLASYTACAYQRGGRRRVRLTDWKLQSS